MLFRSGLEHFLLLSQEPGAEDGVADDMVEALGQIAGSAVAGAGQVAAGRAVSLEGVREGITALGPAAGVTHGVAARFGAAGQVAAFEATPPVRAALAGTGGLPVGCAAALHFDTVPVDNSRETAPGQDAQGPWWDAGP